MLQTQVLIAGGGPVGMTLALELARYGVKSILVERNSTTTRHPKMDLTNGRSMELFRRLGIVENLRDAGVPRENPFDISWITSLSGHELHRFHYPSSAQTQITIRESNDGSHPREAPLRVSQIDIEPVLKGFIDEHPLITVMFGVSFESIVEETSEGLIVEIKNQESGIIDHVSCQYLAGCDGGGSRVRRSLGIELEGDLAVASAYMVHFHSTDTELLQRWGVTWHYQNGAGTLIAQNDRDSWTLQAWLPPGEDGSSWVASEVLESWIGKPFDYTILQANPWSAHFVVAEQYRKGRALLAGDSAHQYIPTGGYGMNSGIADAIGLAWALAANLQGWGGDALLDAYAEERKSTAWRCLEASRRHMGIRVQISELYQSRPAIEDDTAEAQQSRAQLAEKIAELGNAENESWGIELGYRYRSPIISLREGTEDLEMGPLLYQPWVEAGFRMPHIFLKDGESIHDKMGQQYTLFMIGNADSAEFESCAAKHSMPLTIVRIDEPHANSILGKRFILVRPDQHIAWADDREPDNLDALLLQISGR
ncbi:MAG: FAD-dependent monooxygenase [Thiohalomonadaceae bacterium]